MVTPSYNQGDFLEETIRSVLLQNYPNLQYIVVDGGSTDESSVILDKYRHLISTVIREDDNGQSDAICKGLDLAEGEFFNWINSDDLLMPGVLWELGTQSTPQIDAYAFVGEVFGEGVESYLMLNHHLSAMEILRCDRYSFSQPGLWLRTKLVHECGGIDRTLNYGFDWDLLIRYLAANPRVHYSSTVGSRFRLHNQSKTIVETSKGERSESLFYQESLVIRDKLEALLQDDLVKASRLGRLRETWNDYLVESLDDLDRSPIGAASEIVWRSIQRPRVCFSTRTLGSVARLLSRYVRPKSSVGSRDRNRP